MRIISTPSDNVITITDFPKNQTGYTDALQKLKKFLGHDKTVSIGELYDIKRLDTLEDIGYRCCINSRTDFVEGILVPNKNNVDRARGLDGLPID